MNVCAHANIYEIQSARPGGFSLLVGAILIAGIIFGMVFVGIMAMDKIVEKVESNAAVTVHLHGDDIEVMILSSSFAEEIISIEVSIDGVSDSRMVIPVTLGTPVFCDDIAVGVTGSKFVVINAMFADGTSAVIHYTRVQFS
ncbi:hypothetical protein [Methanorbis furvi]|uniref:Uncharacterized protein n=1 Tax=Methanorbis furvi TaxID=3028299 RepID=A0AAE4MBX8_9EURY|nr:hypothetical protein [Methanocorpusculaceae archaeon Ag1]